MQDLSISWWGRFEDPGVEASFREYHRVREHRLTLLSLATGILLAAVFSLTDRQLLGVTATFWYLFSARAVHVAGSTAFLLFLLLRPRMTPATLDRLLLAWACSGAALTLAVGLTRTGIYFMGQVFVALFILWVFYFAAPLPLPVQLAMTAILVVGHLYLLLTRHADLDPILRRSVVVGYGVTAIVAVVVSRSLYHLRRRQFANLQQEKALRKSLEEALAEVRTLQGILPICAHCKSVRDDQGSWQEVEDYVRDHSHAEFSHGICPKCIRLHYPAYAKTKDRSAGQSAKP
jgi:hypothetical protein